MKHLTLLTAVVLTFGCVSMSFAQNLVPNPSFEEVPSPFCGIMSQGDFSQTLADWINPTQASPSVYSTSIEPACYNFQPISEYDGPIGIKGSQMPRTGETMAGIWVYTIPDFNQRQYIQVEFESPLEVGIEYEVEFYVSLADSMEFYTDKLGAYLSVNAPSSMNDGPLNFTPQVEASSFIDEASEWVLVSGTIVAQEAYEYITIGNFYNDASTETLSNPLHSGAISTYGAYYFIDDVNVSATSSNGINEPIEKTISIYPTLVTNVLIIEGVGANEPTQIDIFNSTGGLVFSSSAQSPRVELNVAAFPEGVYHVVLSSATGRITQKVVKQD